MNRRASRELAPPKRERSFFWAVLGVLGIGVVGFADFLTGPEISFALFYLIPIGAVAWFSGRTYGFAMSVAGAIAWGAVDALSGNVYSAPAIRYWNAGVRLGFFTVVTVLLPALQSLEREKKAARADDLTGAANRRHLFEALQAELHRAQRYKRPFAVAYIDIDDFKRVNDRWGHRMGDRLLRAVVDRARRHLRKTDLLARLGGDEFVLLLAETDQEAAQKIAAKIQSALQDEMQRNHWPVTFSIGVLTYQDGPMTPGDLIRRADDLMYSVKKQGKNRIESSLSAA